MKIRISDVAISDKKRTTDEIVAGMSPKLITAILEIECASKRDLGNRIPTTEFQEAVVSAIRQGLANEGIKQTEMTDKQRDLLERHRRW